MKTVNQEVETKTKEEIRKFIRLFKTNNRKLDNHEMTTLQWLCNIENTSREMNAEIAETLKVEYPY